jgi:hypothetical protein
MLFPYIINKPPAPPPQVALPIPFFPELPVIFSLF